MRIDPFPVCCTGMIISNFGGSNIAQNYWETDDMTVEQIEQYIKGQALVHSSYAFFCATTNNQQNSANTALVNLGFYSSEWMSKRKHPETQVKLWWKPVQELLNCINPPIKTEEQSNETGL